jgi:UDP-glucose 4-epimerase
VGADFECSAARGLQAASLRYLAKGGRYECFNLGNGDGATVLEVIEAAKKVTGKNFR